MSPAIQRQSRRRAHGCVIQDRTLPSTGSADLNASPDIPTRAAPSSRFNIENSFPRVGPDRPTTLHKAKQDWLGSPMPIGGASLSSAWGSSVSERQETPPADHRRDLIQGATFVPHDDDDAGVPVCGQVLQHFASGPGASAHASSALAISKPSLSRSVTPSSTITSN